MTRGSRNLAASLTIAAALAGCAVNPATGERQLSLVSVDEEIRLGRTSAAEVRHRIGLVDDARLQAYVERIGQQLASASERPSLLWSFQVVDDPSPNAFALPGGFIFVTRGLMGLMGSEAQLASVLGHEIGHVTARHSVTMISKQQLAQLGLGLGTAFYPELGPIGQAIGAGLSLLFLKYGRDAEHQADELGFRYASARNYDLRAMATVFDAIQRTAALEHTSTLPSWLQTHPEPGERIAHVNEMLDALPSASAGRVDRPAYLDEIDGLVYGQNPRQGYFENGHFYHPELRFSFEIPYDWQAQNGASAVIAAAPQGAAALQLTLVEDGGEVAMRRFAAQPGVRIGRVSTMRIHGIPATTAPFQVAAGGSRVRGLIAYLSHRDRTFELAAYATAASWAEYRERLESVIRSFSPVTDPGVLAAAPHRLEIVRLDRDTTLEQFDETYESVIPLGELAIINHVPNGASRLAAGALVKRVVGSRTRSAATPR
ncbi:MAG: M48 family metalloprotease [Vicinamibacterales bacterium]